MNTRLRELDGQVSKIDYGDGLVLDYLLFDCPNPRCNREHSQGIPFSSEPCHRVSRPARLGGGEIVVWHLEQGSTADDITLSPSVLVPSCDGLHGFVVAGEWRPC